MKFAALCVGAVLLASVSTVNSWGRVGHGAVGVIAGKFLSQDVLEWVTNAIADQGGDLARAADWGDIVKHKHGYRWTGPLHYADTDDWKCSFDQKTDCRENICVTAAIGNFSQQLNSFDPQSQSFAMKMILHLVGDVHQPLHVGFRSDRGGNDLTGAFFGRSGNLHAVWDDHIIEHRVKTAFNGDRDAFLQYLVQQARSEFSSQLSNWMSYGSGQEVEWASESANMACKYAYVDAYGDKIDSGFDLAFPYFNRTFPQVEFQLIKAGVRLAGLLTKAHSINLNVQVL